MDEQQSTTHTHETPVHSSSVGGQHNDPFHHPQQLSSSKPYQSMPSSSTHNNPHLPAEHNSAQGAEEGDHHQNPQRELSNSPSSDETNAAGGVGGSGVPTGRASASVVPAPNPSVPAPVAADVDDDDDLFHIVADEKQVEETPKQAAVVVDVATVPVDEEQQETTEGQQLSTSGVDENESEVDQGEVKEKATPDDVAIVAANVEGEVDHHSAGSKAAQNNGDVVASTAHERQDYDETEKLDDVGVDSGTAVLTDKPTLVQQGDTQQRPPSRMKLGLKLKRPAAQPAVTPASAPAPVEEQQEAPKGTTASEVVDGLDASLWSSLNSNQQQLDVVVALLNAIDTTHITPSHAKEQLDSSVEAPEQQQQLLMLVSTVQKECLTLLDTRKKGAILTGRQLNALRLQRLVVDEVMERMLIPLAISVGQAAMNNVPITVDEEGDATATKSSAAAAHLEDAIAVLTLNQKLRNATDTLLLADAAKGSIFRLPVPDEVAPGYSKVVTEPISIVGTLYEKIRAAQLEALHVLLLSTPASTTTGMSGGSGYTSEDHFIKDLRTMTANSAKYNGDESEFTKEAGRLKSLAQRCLSGRSSTPTGVVGALDAVVTTTTNSVEGGAKDKIVDIARLLILAHEEAAKADKSKKAQAAAKKGPTEPSVEATPASGGGLRLRLRPPTPANAPPTTSKLRLTLGPASGRATPAAVAPPPAATVGRAATPRTTRSASARAATGAEEKVDENPSKRPAKGGREKKSTDRVYWVQCDACDEWRELPEELAADCPRWVCKDGGFSCTGKTSKKEDAILVKSGNSRKKKDEAAVPAPKPAGKKGTTTAKSSTTAKQQLIDDESDVGEAAAKKPRAKKGAAATKTAGGGGSGGRKTPTTTATGGAVAASEPNGQVLSELELLRNQMKMLQEQLAQAKTAPPPPPQQQTSEKKQRKPTTTKKPKATDKTDEQPKKKKKLELVTVSPKATAAATAEDLLAAMGGETDSSSSSSSSSSSGYSTTSSDSESEDDAPARKRKPPIGKKSVPPSAIHAMNKNTKNPAGASMRPTGVSAPSPSGGGGSGGSVMSEVLRLRAVYNQQQAVFQRLSSSALGRTGANGGMPGLEPLVAELLKARDELLALKRKC